MAKKHVRHAHARRHVAAKPVKGDTLVVVRGWMFVVAFALMLGIGGIVGSYFNRMLNESTPMVAGASIVR